MDLNKPDILTSIVDKALNYYDEQNNKYKKYTTMKVSVNRHDNIITFIDGTETYDFQYEVLGVFDNSTNIWIWAWMFPDFVYAETNIVRMLLNYGLKITPTLISGLTDERLYLKTQLINSRFLLNDFFQLELHLAISSYLAKDNFKFIYGKKTYLNKDKTTSITIYYLIK
jgi:hypothetical protein